MTSFPLKKHAIALVSAVLLCLLARPAEATDAERKAELHLRLGQKLFAEHKYTAAIEELRAGYVLSPQPRFLFALGQAYRLNHQCTEAVRAYRDFMSANPPRSQAELTEQNIQRCAQEDPSSVVEPEPAKPVAAAPVVTPAPAPTSPVEVRPAPAPLVAAAPPPHKPAYKKWWVWTTVGVVVVGAGLGVGLGLGLRNASGGFQSTLPDVGPGASMALTH